MKGTTNIPATAVVFRRDNKVLFVQRKKTGWMDGYYGIPGGHVEPGESFRQAACREVMEEVGIKLEPSQLTHILTLHQWYKEGIRVGITFEATQWQGEPKNTDPEHASIAWFSLDELPKNIIPTHRMAVEAIDEPYQEIGWPTSD